MAMNTVGSIRKLTLDGIVYNVAADANFSEKFTNYEKEMLPSSGAAMLKMTRKVPIVEGVVLLVNGVEREQIKALADQLEDITVNYVDAAGNTFRTTGTIAVEARETESGRLTLSIMSRTDWAAFPVTQ